MLVMVYFLDEDRYEVENMTLHQLPIGQSAIITKVGGEGELRYRFLDMGLIPKTKVTVTKVAPMGDPIEIRLRGYTLTLRVEDAKTLKSHKRGLTYDFALAGNQNCGKPLFSTS